MPGELPTLMKFPAFFRQKEQKEQNDHVQAHRCSFAGSNHLVLCLELGERFEIPGLYGFISTAQAIVGRPLTPMSYAGVARRTRGAVRRAFTTARPSAGDLPLPEPGCEARKS